MTKFATENYPRADEWESQGYVVGESTTVCQSCMTPEDRSGTMAEDAPALLSGDTDSPANCARCGCTIKESLTERGEAYVREYAGAERDHLWYQVWPYLLDALPDGEVTSRSVAAYTVKFTLPSREFFCALATRNGVTRELSVKYEWESGNAQERTAPVPYLPGMRFEQFDVEVARLCDADDKITPTERWRRERA